MENEIVIHNLNKLIDFGKVNELQAIVEVAINAITAIKELTRERDALLRDFEILAEVHRPCELCSKKNCRERNEVTEMHCPVIDWRGVCEENGGVTDGE